MTTKISASTFSGSGRVFDGTLAAALMGIAQNQALIAASAVTDLTDNSGGTGSSTLAEVAAFTLAEVGTDDAAQKAELEGSFDDVVDGLMEIVAQVNTILAKVPAFPALVDSMGGTEADGTIAAIDVSMTGVSASMASATGANVVLATLLSRAAQLTVWVNKLAAAAGLTGLTDNMGATVVYSNTFAAVDTSTGDAADGSDTTAANAIIKKADADAQLGLLADIVASLADMLNSITASANATPAAKVVAA